jgi:hypothetical protein
MTAITQEAAAATEAPVTLAPGDLVMVLLVRDERGPGQFAEVEGGLVSVGEADDHAGGAADGLEVGVEGGQQQAVGCSMRLMAPWVTPIRPASLTWVNSAA